MQDVVRDGMEAGALGLSVSREKGHFDPQGVPIPALWADEKEIFALADVLREMGTGTIQAGGGQYVELKDGMMRAPRRGDRPHRRLQQPVADDAPPGRVEDAHGAGRGDRGAGHPRLSDVQPEPGDAGLHDEELARCSAACRPGTRSC